MTEEWRDIKGYEGRYQVSNLGRVKTLKKQVDCGYSKKRTLKEKILKPIVKTHGYGKGQERVHVNLYYDSDKYKTMQVSRLVAKAFFEDFDEKLLVLHIDNDTHNNRLSNLKMGTYSENNQQAWDQGRQTGNKTYEKH